MRVTRKMMTQNMVTWMNKQKERLADATLVNASGRKINSPSDGSLEAGRIVGDRATLSQYGQYQSNIVQGQIWAEMANTVLDAVYATLQEAESITADQMSGDLSTREELLQTLENYYDQIVDYANTTCSGTYLYSGTASTTQPFVNESEVEAGVAQDLLFDLADAAASVTIEISDAAGNVVRTITTTGTAGTNSVPWDGLDDLGTAVADGTYTYTVAAEDASGNNVASTHTYRGEDGVKTVIVGENSTAEFNTDGGEMFSDLLMAVSEAIAAMEEPYDQTALSNALPDIQAALEGLEKEMIDLSYQAGKLEDSDAWLEIAVQTYTDKLSAEESSDETEAAAELLAQKTAYEISVETASKVLEMTTLIQKI